MKDKPNWERGDTLRSIVDFSVIGALALKEVVVDSYGWIRERTLKKDLTESEEGSSIEV